VTGAARSIMTAMTRTLRGWVAVAPLAFLLGSGGTGAQADDSQELPPPPNGPGETSPPPSECRVIDLELKPTAALQMVAWIEDPAGTYIDTIYITQATGSYGLGNRPGVFSMRSGPRWPYGPREDVFPVWAHRHGMQWPKVVFRNGDGDPGGPLDCAGLSTNEEVACKSDSDRNLSHPFTESSPEIHYTRPLRPDEPGWDIGSAASDVFTDKGRIHAEDGAPQLYSLYPMRDDVIYNSSRDDADVLQYDDLNPFDAVSQATPVANQPYRYSWLIPQDLYDGTTTDYVMFVEVSKEFDPNETYNPTTMLTAAASGWNEYGQPYRGQPSVVYRIPFQIGAGESRVITAEPIGYGDPTGADGNLRPIDGTMSMTTPGSGGLRLEVVHDDVTGEDFQIRVNARFKVDQRAPGSVGEIAVMSEEATTARIEFTAPGDDGMVGRAAGFDVRYLANVPITYANFGSAPRVLGLPDPGAAGERQQVDLAGLLPSTKYYVAVRAYDSCRNYGPLELAELVTPERPIGEVDACFIATAAYGSIMANDVVLLRRFRDTMLRSNVLGELAVETYYTFSPAIANIIGESELFRSTTRAALAPIIATVKDAALPYLPYLPEPTN
jgi:hypothetical protein